LVDESVEKDPDADTDDESNGEIGEVDARDRFGGEKRDTNKLGFGEVDGEEEGDFERDDDEGGTRRAESEIDNEGRLGEVCGDVDDGAGVIDNINEPELDCLSTVDFEIVEYWERENEDD
jgi:hypothetical protein